MPRRNPRITELKLLDYIKLCLDNRGYPPSCDEIMAAFHVTNKSARRMLALLEMKGKIVVDWDHHFGISVVAYTKLALRMKREIEQLRETIRQLQEQK